MLPLQALTPEALAAALPEVELASARRILSAVHRFGHLNDPVRNVRRVELDIVRQHGEIPRLELVREQRSTLDPFIKFAFRVDGGQLIETVRIPLEKPGRFSVCVSSQVGCALACEFCATGRLGLKRNLEVWEIVEQVREVRRSLSAKDGQRVHGVVFQGMGEPMANLSRVLQAIAVFAEPSAQAIDARNITVCTSGLPSGILRLAEEAPRVRLGWSIGSPRQEVRRQLMPIARAHEMNEVFSAVVRHTKQTGLSPLWALTLLKDVNDSEEDALALVRLIEEFQQRAGLRPRLSIIPYNSISEKDDPFQRVGAEREDRFREVLSRHGIGSHRRYSGGSDVQAACGQLAAQA